MYTVLFMHCKSILHIHGSAGVCIIHFLLISKRSLQQLESDSSSTEELLREVISKLQKRLDQTSLELEAAKEEIAVKVAQVKQYQKQVEAYKKKVGYKYLNFS